MATTPAAAAAAVGVALAAGVVLLHPTLPLASTAADGLARFQQRQAGAGGVAGWLAPVPPPVLMGVAVIVAVWLVGEVAFFLHVRRLHRQLNRVAPPPRVLPDPEAYLARLLDVLDCVPYPMETFVSLWCGAKRIADVRWGNVATFLAWAFYSRDPAALDPAQRATLDRMVATIRRRYRHRLVLEEGFNPELKALRMTMEPLEFYHRPLLAYLLISHIPRMLLRCSLAQGFRLLRDADGHGYWFRAGTAGSREQEQGLPLVFFHGVGGLGMYVGLIKELTKKRGGAPVVLVEIPHVVMTLEAFEAKDQEQVVRTVRSICDRHGIDRFCVAGHSYGTIWAGWVIRGLKDRVKQAVLLGPVTFLLFLPTTQHGFNYRKPFDPDHEHEHHLLADDDDQARHADGAGSGSDGHSNGNGATASTPAAAVPSTEQQGDASAGKLQFPSPPPLPPPHRPKTLLERARHLGLDLILHYIISRELTVANAMRRQFWWYEKALWADDIHCPLIVGMGTCDRLLAVPAIEHHVRTHHPHPEQVEVILWDGCCHAEFLLAPCLQRSLAKAVRKQEQALGLAPTGTAAAATATTSSSSSSS